MRSSQRDHGFERTLSEHIQQTLRQVGGFQPEDRLAVAHELDRKFGMGDGSALDDIEDVSEFGVRALEEFPARGDIEEEVLHDHRRSVRMRVARHDRPRFSGQLQHDRHIVLTAARLHRHLCDSSDRRERFAAEPVRPDRFEIVVRRDLARGMAQEREHRILLIHPHAVVGDLDVLLPAITDDDLQRRRSRIQRVLDQFLHHGVGTLDHFAGGDLVGEMVREDRHAAARYGVGPVMPGTMPR